MPALPHSFPKPAVALALSTALAASQLGCHRDTKSDANAAPSAAASQAPSAAPIPAPDVPIGPMFSILAGVGIGPIRFGANVATIERLMKAPCDVKTDTLCRYVNQAVEFQLNGGATERIYIPCHERMTVDAAGNKRHFGYFHGLIPPDIALGMLPSAVEEKLGKAPKTEAVPEPNDTRTVRRDTYPGLVVEYDKHANGSLILCGVTLSKLQK